MRSTLKTALSRFNPSSRVFRRLFSQQSKPLVRIFFGSQTGTAQGFAEELSHGVLAKKTKCELLDLADYNPSQLSQEAAACVFVVSCYGQGEPTDNARNFYDWLMSGERAPESLSGVKFSVFGLGSSETHASHYNVVSKAVDKKLEQLGATRLFPLGLGDDSKDIEEDFAGWQEGFIQKILASIDTPSAAPSPAASSPTPAPSSSSTATAAAPATASDATSDSSCDSSVLKFSVDVKNATEASRLQSYFSSADPLNSFYMPQTQLLSCQENFMLNPSYPSRSIWEMLVDVSGKSGLQYQTGDHIIVYPVNSPALVSFYLEKLSASGNELVSLTPSNPCAKPPFTGPVPLAHALSCFTDLTSVPSARAIRSLAECALSVSERDALLQLASRNFYSQHVVKSGYGLADILKDFPSIRLSLDRFFDLAPRLQPRAYSISSSAKAHPTQLRLTYRPVNWSTVRGHAHAGVCSSWMAQVKPSLTTPSPAASSTAEALQSLYQVNLLPSYVRSSTFRLPTDPLRPMLMIAGGTGIAPLRGFVEERLWERETGAVSSQYGRSVLFYGCRTPDEHGHISLLENAVRNNVLHRVSNSFSHTSQPRLVSEDILAHGPEVWKLLEDGCNLYICGGATGFSRSVAQALKKIIQQQSGRSAEQTEQYFERIFKSGRYMEDVSD
eukprot:TRINITY_DN10054_c0_g1_i1.p1 TRINITY_DN10054_c0_g1~~TRINITY_DN10054_c0_g1_i1.p1  ORF type:complete len:670 (+),score=138.47 TRINITY_DN10054_c0_g1_i1:132-2141(+)